jgi:hypothetical protein
MAVPDPHSFWKSKARLCAGQINAVRWLESANPWLLGLCLGWSCVVLAARGMHAGGGGWLWISPVLLALWIAGERAVFLHRKRRWFGLTQAYVFLEDRLALKSRLTVAREGLIPWPPVPPTLPALLHWNGGRLAGPPLFGCLLLLAAAFVPVGGEGGAGRKGTERPQVLNQLESWVEAIEREQLVDPKSVEELRKQFEELDKLGPEEWFKHGTLEAADHLQDRTGQDLKQLDRKLEETRKLLMEASRMDAMTPPSQAKAWEQDYQQALNALRAGGLPLDSALLDKLKGLDPGQIRSMSEQDLQNALDRLKKGQSMCQGCTGGGELEDMLAALEKGGEGQGKGECEGPGSGAPTRGPGTAPLTLNREESRADAGQEGALTSEDLSRAAFGDVTGITQGRHDVDPSKSDQNREGGVALSHGRGGETVWTTPLTPEEQQAVRRFFE